MIQKWVLICLTSCLFIHTFAQRSEKGDAYVNAYKEIAMNEMLRTGVPAAISLAQGILESQYGESDLSKQSNNHFGLKCKNDWTGKRVYHDDDFSNECFRSYPTVADSYKDHSDFLKSRPHYAFLFHLDPSDYEGWVKGLKKAGYATEADYSQMLIKVISDYNLNQYSLLALQKKQEGQTSFASNTSVTNEPIKEALKETTSKPVVLPKKEIVQEMEVDTEKEEPVITKIHLVSNKEEKPSTFTSPYPDSPFTINHSKVIYAKAGTSLLAIANKYDISLGSLYSFNGMDEEDILVADKLLFLEKKMKKGSKDFHVVENDESLYDICQKEGVRIESVLEYNHLKKNASPKVGDKIYLRTPTNSPTAKSGTNTSQASNSK